MEFPAGQDGRAKGRVWAVLRAAPRAAEWWEYKLVPIMAVFYATAIFSGAAPADLWKSALVLLAALAPGALYVSVLNDITDRRDDAAAGKTNRMAGASPVLATALLAAPLGVGVFFLWWWRETPWLQLPYLAAWIAFTLYSAPPVRLKQRGLAGVLADAAGSNLFPALVAVALAWSEPDLGWAVVVGAWGLAYGVRGILWHQLGDADNDAAAGVRTFVVRNSPAAGVWLGRFAGAVEFAALVLLLAQLGLWAPAAGLGFYLLFAGMKFAYWRLRAAVIEPGPDRQLAGGDYYDVILPISLLLAASVQAPRNLLLLAAHLIVFPNRWRVVGGELTALAGDLRRRARNRLARQPQIRAVYRGVRDRYRARASRQ